MQTPDYGVLVARCQVDELHEGHLALFREVKARHNRVILFLGQKPIGSTYNNPLDFETRKAMVQKMFPDFFIFPLTDRQSDEQWSKDLDAKIYEVADYGKVTLYGGRDSFVPHYTGRHKPEELVLPQAVLGHSGTDIRARLTNTVKESPEFRAGIIYAITNLKPQCKATVDVVITHYKRLPGDGTRQNSMNMELNFLLGRKPGVEKWQFIGGFSEPNTPSYESDAIREVKEETNLDVAEVQFIGSALIPDWRWKGEPDQIKSLIFTGASETMDAKAKDDIAEVRWFPAHELKADLFTETHRDSIFPIVYKHFNLSVWDTLLVGQMNVTYTHMSPKELAAEGLK
jgi:bifunctional NMN adenylyltransferase/nudix hydrolase